jgi:hypothetical protein
MSQIWINEHENRNWEKNLTIKNFDARSHIFNRRLLTWIKIWFLVRERYLSHITLIVHEFYLMNI